jgi:cytoskeletal protein RodZ
MEPEVTHTSPIRSVLIFIAIGLVLLVAVVVGVRWAKGRSDQLANANKPQTVAQQPTQQPATHAQTETQKKAEADKKAAEQKAADDKKKADAAAAAEKTKQDQVAKDKAAAEKAAADKTAADKAAADKAAADKAAADQKAAAEKNKVASTPNTGPAPVAPKTVPSTGVEDVILQFFGLSLLAFLTIRYVDSRRRLNTIS